MGVGWIVSGLLKRPESTMEYDTPFSKRFEHHWGDIRSEHFQGTCYYNLWKPRGKLRTQPPLLVFIGGMQTEEQYYNRRKTYPQAYEDVLTEMIESCDLKMMAFLAVPGPFERSDVDYLQQYSDLISHELIPAVEEKYQIGDNRLESAIIGVSAGGCLAMRCALQSNDFCLAAAHSSPGLNPLIPLLEDGKVKDIHLFVDWGCRDIFQVQLSAFPFWEAAHGKCRKLHGGEYDGGHDWRYFRERVKLSLALAGRLWCERVNTRAAERNGHT